MVWPFGHRARSRRKEADRSAQETPRRIHGRYDAAQTTVRNARQWAEADNLGPITANSAATRAILRSRGRYEYDNNSWLTGMVATLAHYVIGTGPRLQMLSDDHGLNSRVERAWSQWSHRVGLPETLRCMRTARAHTGEAFVILGHNNALPGPVKLHPQVIEADRVADPYLSLTNSPLMVDGIEFDRAGNPVRYYILDAHPGDARWPSARKGKTKEFYSGEWLPASQVLHYFHASRPGQRRGIPDITPALPLFSKLRRFTIATIEAAETAANFAAVLKTPMPPDPDSDNSLAPEAMDTVELEPSAATVLPDGWDLGQVRAEHPATSFAEFARFLINEITRCIGVPLNIALGNSSEFNYASGRLDAQAFLRMICVEQSVIERAILDRIFDAWLEQSALITGLLPQDMRTVGASDRHDHAWYWDGYQHIDPLKEASAQRIRLASGTTTLKREFAQQGLDWETEARQRAREYELLKELGLVETDEEKATTEQ